MPRLLHVSDLHFGKPSIAARVEALEAIVAREQFNVIVISGDLTQRARRHEFRRARGFVEYARRFAPVFTIPGNHDVAWWFAPMGFGSRSMMYARYRKFVHDGLEPTLRMPGLTIVGLNSAQGVQSFTLTARPRDISVVGALLPAQWEHARQEFAASPCGDVKVLVIHHNLLKGRLSKRWGLASRARGIVDAASTGADLVLCGHDHEDRIEQTEALGRKFVVSTANTLSDRTRGDLASALNVIDADATELCVASWEWSESSRTFGQTRRVCFTR